MREQSKIEKRNASIKAEETRTAAVHGQASPQETGPLPSVEQDGPQIPPLHRPRFLPDFDWPSLVPVEHPQQLFVVSLRTAASLSTQRSHLG
jgi:hypothetical protein